MSSAVATLTSRKQFQRRQWEEVVAAAAEEAEADVEAEG